MNTAYSQWLEDRIIELLGDARSALTPVRLHAKLFASSNETCQEQDAIYLTVGELILPRHHSIGKVGLSAEAHSKGWPPQKKSLPHFSSYAKN